MPGPSKHSAESESTTNGFVVLIGSIVVTVGVMVASLVIAANHLPR